MALKLVTKSTLTSMYLQLIRRRSERCARASFIRPVRQMGWKCSCLPVIEGTCPPEDGCERQNACASSIVPLRWSHRTTSTARLSYSQRSRLKRYRARPRWPSQTRFTRWSRTAGAGGTGSMRRPIRCWKSWKLKREMRSRDYGPTIIPSPRGSGVKGTVDRLKEVPWNPHFTTLSRAQ